MLHEPPKHGGQFYTSCQTPPTLSQPRSHRDKLRYVEWDDWEAMNSYEEGVPGCLHHRIVWKVVVNNKTIFTDFEKDVVVSPVPYWHMVLRPKLEKLLFKKVPQNRPDLIKRFDDLSIDWSVIAKTLMGWGEHLNSGKKLTINLSFNYIDTKPPPLGSARHGTKRGSLATKKMLADRDAQLEAEEDTGSAPIWKEVSSRQKASPPEDTAHAGAHLLQGNTLKCHDDVPEDFCEQLYLEERQQLEKQPKNNNVSLPYPPINITNVLPQSQAPMTGSIAPTPQGDVRPCGNVSISGINVWADQHKSGCDFSIMS